MTAGPKNFSKSILDFEQISFFLSLRDEHEWETLQDIFTQFKADITTRLEDIDRALGDFDRALGEIDLPALSLAAHSVKGCAGTFGMRLVETIAGEIDMRARAFSPWGGFSRAVKNLHGAWDLSLTELEHLFAQHDAAQKAEDPSSAEPEWA